MVGLCTFCKLRFFYCCYIIAVVTGVATAVATVVDDAVAAVVDAAVAVAAVAITALTTVFAVATAAGKGVPILSRGHIANSVHV